MPNSWVPPPYFHAWTISKGWTMCALKAKKISKKNLDKFDAKKKEFWISKTLSHKIWNPNIFLLWFDPQPLSMYERREEAFWMWKRPGRGLLSYKTRGDWRGITEKAWGAYVAQGRILILLGFYLMTYFNLIFQTKSNQN